MEKERERAGGWTGALWLWDWVVRSQMAMARRRLS